MSVEALGQSKGYWPIQSYLKDNYYSYTENQQPSLGVFAKNKDKKYPCGKMCLQGHNMGHTSIAL